MAKPLGKLSQAWKQRPRYRNVWRCTHCRATFPFEDHLTTLHCPYCDRARLTLVKQRVN